MGWPSLPLPLHAHTDGRHQSVCAAPLLVQSGHAAVRRVPTGAAVRRPLAAAQPTHQLEQAGGGVHHHGRVCVLVHCHLRGVGERPDVLHRRGASKGGGWEDRMAGHVRHRRGAAAGQPAGTTGPPLDRPFGAHSLQQRQLYQSMGSTAANAHDCARWGRLPCCHGWLEGGGHEERPSALTYMVGSGMVVR